MEKNYLRSDLLSPPPQWREEEREGDRKVTFRFDEQLRQTVEKEANGDSGGELSAVVMVVGDGGGRLGFRSSRISDGFR